MIVTDCYTIVSKNDPKTFISIDRSSGGYPYETNYFALSLIANREVISDYYNDLDNNRIDKSKYVIKKIALI